MRASALIPVALAALVLPGCIFDRKEPVPQHTVTVTPDVNRYAFDGQPMGYEQLEVELKALADKNRQSATGNARAYVKIITEPGASFDRTMELVDYCSSVGLDKIETVGR